ncbi:MAG: thymidylate synthase, partial [Candidatus Kaiserbacteria bacterium]|nr:thymidylate synthase [Candidatus Kaiserbacteria bacterium]
GIFKFVVAEGVIDMCMTQRSADLPVGVPFNIASYSLLLLMVAQVTGLTPGTVSHYLTDIHIYNNQVDLMTNIQLAREPWALPRVLLNPSVKNIFDFKIDDFILEGYDPYPSIKYPVGV